MLSFMQRHTVQNWLQNKYSYPGGKQMNDRYLYRAKRKDDGELLEK